MERDSTWQRKARGGPAAAVEVAGGDGYGLGGGEHLVAPLAEAVGAAVVDEGVEVGAEAVVEVADDEVIVAVAVQVGDRAGPGAVGGYLDGLAAAQRVAVAEGRGLLAVVVVVGEYEVEVAVAVQVELVDALEDARAGDV